MTHPNWKKEKASRLRKNGWRMQSIATEINVPVSTVCSWFAHRKPKINGVVMNEDIMSRKVTGFYTVRELRATGMSYKAISQATGVARSTVRVWCLEEPKVYPNGGSKNGMATKQGPGSGESLEGGINSEADCKESGSPSFDSGDMVVQRRTSMENDS